MGSVLGYIKSLIDFDKWNGSYSSTMRAFHLMDKNNDGTITYAEFDSLIRELKAKGDANFRCINTALGRKEGFCMGA